jgi:hypothetical protein
MILFEKNFINKSLCREIINFYKKNQAKSYIHHESYPLNIYDCDEYFSTDTIKNLKSIFLEIKNLCENYCDCPNSLSCYNYQITKWPMRSNMPWHFDLDHTTFSCIVYLNDSYLGGRTLFRDNQKVKDSGSLLIIKNPYEIEHSVEKIYFGCRYTLSLWFCNEKSQYYLNKVNKIIEGM